MKCQILFLGKLRKNVISFSSAGFVHSMVSVNTFKAVAIAVDNTRRIFFLFFEKIRLADDSHKITLKGLLKQTCSKCHSKNNITFSEKIDRCFSHKIPHLVSNILSWRWIMKYFLRSFSPFR